MAQDSTAQHVLNHLHAARMDPYMQASSQNLELALRLYLWNTQVSGALFETLSITEVLFRNAIDDALRKWNASQGPGYSWEWTARAAKPLNSMIRKPLRIARTNAETARSNRDSQHPRKDASIDHNDLVAQLSFGVYARLMPTQDPNAKNYVQRKILWREALQTAFTGRPHDQPQAHAGRVERLHTLRNRVAHAEPVLNVKFKSRVRDMVRLAQSINPDLAGWVSGTTRVHSVVAQRPHSPH